MEQMPVSTRRVKRPGRLCACLFGRMTAGVQTDGRVRACSELFGRMTAGLLCGESI